MKGFTDSLRLELESEGAPVAITLIQPAAIDTPYPEHAKSYLGVAPTHRPPVYAPEVVARAILRSAEHPERNVLVGGGAEGVRHSRALHASDGRPVQGGEGTRRPTHE